MNISILAPPPPLNDLPWSLETDHNCLHSVLFWKKYNKYFLQMDPLEQVRRPKRLKVAQLVENIASPLRSKIFCPYRSVSELVWF